MINHKILFRVIYSTGLVKIGDQIYVKCCLICFLIKLSKCWIIIVIKNKGGIIRIIAVYLFYESAAYQSWIFFIHDVLLYQIYNQE